MNDTRGPQTLELMTTSRSLAMLVEQLRQQNNPRLPERIVLQVEKEAAHL